MKSLGEFWHFVRESSLEILANRRVYISAFIALILLGNTESLWPALGVSPESTTSIALTVVTALLTFVVLAQIVLIQKKKHGGEGQLSFIVPTFLLYNLYYTMVFFAALFLPAALIYIPFVTLKLSAFLAGQILFYLLMLAVLAGAFYLNVLFFLVPLVAVCADDVTEKFFKVSRVLARKNLGVVAWLAFFSLLLEFSFLGLSFIDGPLEKAIATFLYSLPDAFFTLALTVAMVKIFYQLRNS